MSDKLKPLGVRLIGEFFDLIASGEKTEEYRELTDYWARRLLDLSGFKGGLPSPDEKDFLIHDFLLIALSGDIKTLEYFMRYRGLKFREFSYFKGTNGFGITRPRVRSSFLRVEVGEGRKEWGAQPGKVYFKILLGGIIGKEHCKYCKR